VTNDHTIIAVGALMFLGMQAGALRRGSKGYLRYQARIFQGTGILEIPRAIFIQR